MGVCVWVMAVIHQWLKVKVIGQSHIPKSSAVFVCWLHWWAFEATKVAEPTEMPSEWTLGPNKPCWWGPHLPTHGKGYFWGTYLGMPRLSSGRYTQRSLQGAAAMRLLAAITAAACCRIDHRICLQMYLVYSESLTYSENNCFKSKSGLETVD